MYDMLSYVMLYYSITSEALGRCWLPCWPPRCCWPPRSCGLRRPPRPIGLLRRPPCPSRAPGLPMPDRLAKPDRLTRRKKLGAQRYSGRCMPTWPAVPAPCTTRPAAAGTLTRPARPPACRPLAGQQGAFCPPDRRPDRESWTGRHLQAAGPQAHWYACRESLDPGRGDFCAVWMCGLVALLLAWQAWAPACMTGLEKHASSAPSNENGEGYLHRLLRDVGHRL